MFGSRMPRLSLAVNERFVDNNSLVKRPTVAVLHPGQMGVAFAAQLRGVGVDVLWCSADRSTRTADRAENAGLRAVPTLTAALAAADVVLSICPPAAAEDLARVVAGHGYQGVFVDANAISPIRMARIHDALQGAGATVVDGAIIGPPPDDATAARLYLSGDSAATAAVAIMFTGTSVETVVLDAAIGTASGLKMAYASYQKATRTLAAVAHALAAEFDVTEHLLYEASRNARSPLSDPDYLPSVAARAWRWAPEMHEVADTLRDVGLPNGQAQAAADTLRRWDSAKDSDLAIDQTLQALRQRPTAG